MTFILQLIFTCSSTYSLSNWTSNWHFKLNMTRTMLLLLPTPSHSPKAVVLKGNLIMRGVPNRVRQLISSCRRNNFHSFIPVI